MSKCSVPVVMHHTVGIPNNNWQWYHLTCPFKLFEDHLKWLKKRDFHTISLQQLYDYMNEGIKLPKNPVVLTFDDGYLDNWIFAYPLLKRYGFKGTIYVNPDFVDPRMIIRNNLEDVWKGKLKLSELELNGYLSWPEMREMEEKGVIDIQSHSMTHTWYPINSKIIDFRHPGDPYLWMTWNEYPSNKPHLQIDDQTSVNYGGPVYENGRAIGVKRFFPDDNLDKHIINYVKDRGGVNFFQFENWKDLLYEVVEKYSEINKLSERYETESEYQQRLYYELGRSKEIIEKRLNKEVRFLCWPGGAVTDSALNIALEVGYKSSTVAKDLQVMRKKLKNRYGQSPLRINRIGVTLFWDGVENSSSNVKYQNGFYFINSLNQFQGNIINRSISSLILHAGVLSYSTKYMLIKQFSETNFPFSSKNQT
jgi:peptidoglycan/xylan/chitin deacetylase (PgdA/CDA1 family)